MIISDIFMVMIVVMTMAILVRSDKNKVEGFGSDIFFKKPSINRNR